MSCKYLLLLLGFMVSRFCAAQDAQYIKKDGQVILTQSGASHFAKLPLRCAEKEFPYKTGITFSDSSLTGSPKNYHPAFFGCFDWHSSVHGHWMLVRLLKLYPGIASAGEIRQLFNTHFTAANIQQELQVF